MNALCLIRPEPGYRRDAFIAGLKAVGYEVHTEPRFTVTPGDLLIIWNRYGTGDKMAQQFEAKGARVIVCENGYLGRNWDGDRWYAMALNQHNGAGKWQVGTPERWKTPLKPWRNDGKHVLILPQRGIGPPGIAMPRVWASAIARQLRTQRAVIVRHHPGERPPERTLEADLEGAWACVTWGSGAALKALVAGIPVFHSFPRWIGARASQLWPADIEEPYLGDREAMFERLSWAQWKLSEIESGEAFRHLLGHPRTPETQTPQ